MTIWGALPSRRIFSLKFCSSTENSVKFGALHQVDDLFDFFEIQRMPWFGIRSSRGSRPFKGNSRSEAIPDFRPVGHGRRREGTGRCIENLVTLGAPAAG